jgi:hypothetical protein
MIADARKVLYFSEMYTRGEMALRLGLFYTAALLSGAFEVGLSLPSLGRIISGVYTESCPGLLSRGLTAIFIIEGLLVCITCPS